MIVFDVGGERGLEAKQFSKLVGESGKVFTFECFPRHIEELQALTTQYSNIQVVDKACWNCKENLTFYTGNTAGSGTAIADAKGQYEQALANTSGDVLVVEADTLNNL